MCGGSKKFSEFQVDCLDAHNEYRSRHGSPRLDLHDGLCQYAEDHAKFLAQCDKAKSSKSPYGENIFIKAASRKIIPDGYEPVKEWYNESKKGCPLNSPSKEIKHFTQVVWKAATSLGVGYAINKEMNKIYIVANYFPPIDDCDPCAFPENVKPVRKPGNDCPSKVKII